MNTLARVPAPPILYDIEMEQALLGAVLLNNRAFEHIAELRPEHFFEPLHHTIFDIARTLYQSGQVADPLTVNALLPAGVTVGDLNGAQYVARLAAQASTVILARDYARFIHAFWMLRRLADVSDEASQFQNRALFPDQAVREAFATLDLLRLDQANQVLPKTAGDAAKTFIDWLNGVMIGDVKPEGVPTGLADIDRMTGGLKGGDLVIMAGRPGMGKTSVGFGVARAVARAGFGAGGFSLEMQEPQLMARIHCDEAFNDGQGDPIVYNHVLNPKQFLTMRQAERLLDAQARIAELPLILDFSSSLSVGEITAKARGMAMTLERKFGTKLKLIVIDYLKQIKSSDRYRGNRVYEIGEIVAGLKQLAKDLNIAVLLLAQLSREVEKRDDKMPQLSDLRDSGDLEAEADLVVFLFRRAYYLQNDPKIATDVALQTELIDCANKLLLMVAKNRHGPTGNVDAYCHIGASAIRNIARPESYEGML